MEQWTRAAISLQGDLGGGVAFAEVRLQHVALVGPTDRESAVELWPGDSGWRGPVGGGWLAAGSFTTPVGQLVALSPLDVLSGRDLRPGLSASPVDTRLPAPAVVAEIGDRAVLSLIWLPVGARDLVPLVGTDSSLLRQDVAAALRDSLLPNDVDLVEQTAALSPQTRRGAEFAFGELDRPAPFVGTHDVALRARAPLGRVQVEALAAWLRSRRPGINDGDDTLLGVDLQVRYPRTALVGAGLSRPVGDAALLKAEGAWTSDRLVQRRDITVVTRPMWSGAAAAERALGGGRGLVGLEARVEHTVGLGADEALMVAPTDVQGAIYSELRLARERLAVQVAGLGSLRFEELALRPGARWLLRDGLWIEGGGLFAIASTTPPHTAAELAAFAGGPIGALSDTDHVRLGLSWAR